MDPDKPAGADHRRRAHHPRILSGVPAGSKRRRCAGVAEGKSGLSAAHTAVILKVRAHLGEPRRMMTRTVQAAILRGAQERAPQDDGGAHPKSALTFANTLRNISGGSTPALVLYRGP